MVEVNPGQLASLYARVEGGIAQVRSAADVAQLRSGDRVLVLLKGETFVEDELLPPFNPTSINRDDFDVMEP